MDNLATKDTKPTAAVHTSIADGNPLNSRKIFGNILSLGTSEIAARAIAFFGITFLARRLGPEGFGIIGFAIAVYSYLALAVTAGFNDVGAREVARRPNKAADTAVNVILVRFALALIIFAAVGLVIWLFEIKENTELVVLLMGLSLFSLAIDTSWVYKGLERNHRVGIALILGQTLYVGTLLLFVKDVNDVLIVPLAQFFGEMSAALLLLVPLLIPLYRLGAIKLNLDDGWQILKSSGFWTVSRLLRTIVYSFDVVLIGFWLGEREVGLYTAPYRICFLFVAIAVAIYTSYLPSIARAFAHSIEQVQEIAGRSINFGATVAAPMVVGGMILAAPLLDFMFGAEYVEGAMAFRLLLLSIGFVFIYGGNHNLFLASDRTKTEMKIFLTAAVINVGLNLIFIRRYGITGAAAITALVEGLTLLMGFFVLYKAGIRLKVFRMILPPVIASLLMGAVLFALSSVQMLFVSLAVGGVCYIVFLAFLSGTIAGTPSYRRSIANFAGELRKRFL
jgi:O-antigen/teichoic acid export membrane protein